MQEIKKQLYLSNSKYVNWDALDERKTGEHTIDESYPHFSRNVVSCKHNNHQFRIEEYSARMGVNSAAIFLNSDEFNSTAELLRFYKEIKTLVVVDPR
jgi:hypothetical protein